MARRRASGAAERDRLDGFVNAVLRTDRRRLVVLTLAGMLTALMQAFAVTLLVPVLSVAGVGKIRGSGVESIAQAPFRLLHVQPTIGVALATYAVITALATVLAAWTTMLQTAYQLDFVDRVRTRLYEAVAAAEWRHLLDVPQAELVTALTVNVGVIGLGATAVLSFGASLLTIVFQLVVAARISPVTTGFAIATAGLLLAATWPLLRHSRRLGRELIAGNRAVTHEVTGFLGGLKLAKASALERTHERAFARSLTRARRAKLDFARATAMSSALRLIVTVGVLAVVIVVAVNAFDVPIAALLVLAFIFSRLVPTMSTLQRFLLQAAQAGPAFEQLVELARACEAAAEPGFAEAEIVVRLPIGSGVRLAGVSFAYLPGRPTLTDVDLDIPARSVVALVGPSGAGKTTVADIIVGLLVPSAGQVRVDGRALDAVDVRRWRRSVSLVPQEPFLFDASVRENLAWAAPDADEARVWRALHEAAAADFVAALPDGLDTHVGARGTRLSGGERQRLALARATLREPDLLVLDEATSALDTENERLVRDALEALRGHITIVVIAHRLSTVRSADVIVVVDNGMVRESGRWTDLADREGGRLQALIRAGDFA